MTEVRREEIPVGDARLSMLTAGPADGGVVLLLHGIPAGAELWRDGVARLGAAGLRACAPDLPGYGHTRVPESADHSLEGAADLLVAWLEQAGIRRVWLVGHDLGGAVAQILVVRHPERVCCLTLANAPAGANWPVPPIRLLRFLAHLGLYPLLAASRLPRIDPYLRWQLRKAVADPAVLRRADARRRIFLDAKIDDPATRRAFARHLTALDNRQTVAVAPRLADVAVPTLLLWGSDDVFLVWENDGEHLRRLLPEPDVQVIAGAGHFLMLDQPDAVYGALLAWGRSVG